MKKILLPCFCALSFLIVSCSRNASSDRKGDETNKPKLIIMEDEDDGNYSRAAEQKMQNHDASEAELHRIVPNRVNAEKQYTVMIYIVGSNLESKYGAATKDIVEMQQSGMDFDKTNLIIYTGGSKRWNSTIPNTKNSVVNLSEEDIYIEAQTEDTTDMGAYSTLAAFVNYCAEFYPAEHYGLILWDHGGGPVWGYGSDELFGNDSLLLDEMILAMDETPFGKNKKLEFIGFDACLMASIENASIWSKYADYMVASQELEAGSGWNYDFLHVLNETADTKTILKEIVNSYEKYYEETKTEFYSPDVTLSVLDLNRTEEMLTAVNHLFERMQDDINEGNYPVLNRARSNSKTFGLSASGSKETAYDLLDLLNFADNLSGLYPDEVNEVKMAAGNFVMLQTTNVENTGGISIYLPGDNAELADIAESIYSDKTILSEPYKEFIDAYTREWHSDSNKAWALEPLTLSGNEMTLQLTEEQMNQMSSATYTILRYNEDGYYTKTTCEVKIQPDENGILHVPADPLLMTAVTDMSESPAPWACIQQSTNEKESVYKTLRTYLTTGSELSGIATERDELVTVTVKNKNGSINTTIQDISSTAGSAWLAGKGTVNISNYKSIVDMGIMSLIPVRDEYGNIRPYNEWQLMGASLYLLGIDQSFHFEMRKASEYDDEFYCQIVIKDVNGQLHASEHAALPKAENKGVFQSVKTEKGELVFELYQDHAEVSGYSGEDVFIEIPGLVNNLPLTCIQTEAFINASALESVIIPASVDTIGHSAFNGIPLKKVQFHEGLKRIEPYAFRGTKLREIELPNGLEQIGRAAFFNCDLNSIHFPQSVKEIGEIVCVKNRNLREISVDRGNKYYQSVDGVLFTKDGKTLIQYPLGKGDSYTIPTGTEIISYGAFADIRAYDEEPVMKQIIFPETLITINNCAFKGCTGLTDLYLPDTLKTIGIEAFCGGNALLSDDSINIRIGKNVSYIGTDAFTAFPVKSFEVSEENQTYASIGGFITNKAKDTILIVPEKIGKVVQIPDGITTLSDGLFSKLPYETEFILPDSVFRFSEETFPCVTESDEFGNYIKNYMISIHCSKGSAAEEYAENYGIYYDYYTDSEDLFYEAKTAENDNMKVSYRKYKKHIVITSYITEDDEDILEIPSKIEGIPVTELRYITYPDQVFTCWDESAEIVMIPETIKKIDPRLLAEYSFSECRIDKNNDYYTVIDGVLFTKDLKTLIFYPDRKEGKVYEIPEPTERIGEYAFYSPWNLSKVICPQTLQNIDKCGFYLADLADIQFNEGLKVIGERAFRSAEFQYDLRFPESLERIEYMAFYLKGRKGILRFPDRLLYIGDNAFETNNNYKFRTDIIKLGPLVQLGHAPFQSILYKEYRVSDENPYYSVKDGSLVSKDGLELLAVPTLSQGNYYVPEGIRTIHYAAFNECEKITDIYFPDSITDIGGTAEQDDTGKYKYRLHCYPGSEAAKHCEAKGILFEPITNE